MRSKKLLPMKLRLFLSSLLLAVTVSLSSCQSLGYVEIPDVESCAAHGLLKYGGSCATSLSHKTRELSADEYISFLETVPKSATSPGHAAAICRSPSEETKNLEALEEACVLLGNHCTDSIISTIQTMRSGLGPFRNIPPKKK